MKRITLIAVTVVAGFTALSTSSASAAKDACAGQVWWEYTQECMDQQVKTFSAAGDHDGDTAANATGQKRLAPRVSKKQNMRYQIKRAR
jgi:hypothetical protein